MRLFRAKLFFRAIAAFTLSEPFSGEAAGAPLPAPLVLLTLLSPVAGGPPLLIAQNVLDAALQRRLLSEESGMIVDGANCNE